MWNLNLRRSCWYNPLLWLQREYIFNTQFFFQVTRQCITRHFSDVTNKQKNCLALGTLLYSYSTRHLCQILRIILGIIDSFGHRRSSALSYVRFIYLTFDQTGWSLIGNTFYALEGGGSKGAGTTASYCDVISA